MRRIYGLETEYGLVATQATSTGMGRRRLIADEAAQAFFAPVTHEYRATNVFLPNGGRLYLDIGAHPEYATEECATIDDVLVAERAGDDIVAALAIQAEAWAAEHGTPTNFTVVKNNIDNYGNSYGSHENYLVSRHTDPELLADWLVPFLVSRQLIAGAGRWHRGLFTLSQRCDALVEVVSNTTTGERPLINTRDEPHADPQHYRRLHVIAGDSLLLEPANWLRWASTALVLRLAESGRPAPLALADPMDALRTWGRDPHAMVLTTTGQQITAEQLQRQWCGLAADISEPGDGTAAWQGVLDGLAAHDPMTPVEWWQKHRLLRAYQERHDLPDHAPALTAVDLRWHELGTDTQGRPRSLARLLEAQGTIARITNPDAVRAALRAPASPTRAVLRSQVVQAARRAHRDINVDWSTITVHDATGPVTIRLDDPWATSHDDVTALIATMTPTSTAMGDDTDTEGVR